MVILYATDLIFTTRIRAEATAVGAAVSVARGVESLRGRLDAARPSGSADTAASGKAAGPLVIVDLDADEALAAIGVASTGAHEARIVAFVSHVRGDLASAARAAGAHAVMARSEFVRRLPELVEGART